MPFVSVRNDSPCLHLQQNARGIDLEEISGEYSKFSMLID